MLLTTSKAKLPGVNVIMIAGENYEGTVRKTAIQKGASAFLGKPFVVQTFLETVKEYVK
jgi:response regulator of citrate/malate metabolism